MKKFVLDTNLYIQAFRSAAGAAELSTFLAAFTPGTYLSSIVLHELLVGANSVVKRKQIDARIARPLQRVGRIVTPSHAAWRTAGEAISEMARRTNRDLRSVPKSLVNDFLLAASCRESGATLVTANTADFESIAGYLPFEYEPPWPS